MINGEQIASARPSGAHPPRARRRSNPATNAIIITVLIVAVIVLFAVFLYVLLNPPQSDAARPISISAATSWLCEAVRHSLFL
jgi:hypothetical protein